MSVSCSRLIIIPFERLVSHKSTNLLRKWIKYACSKMMHKRINYMCMNYSKNYKFLPEPEYSKSELKIFTRSGSNQFLINFKHTISSNMFHNISNNL